MEIQQELRDLKTPKQLTNIILPDDEALIELLTQKMQDYLSRFDENESIPNDRFKAPEQKTAAKKIIADAKYKIAIIKELLAKKKVTFKKLVSQFQEQDKEFVASELYNAFGVIDDYCKTGGKNVSGGTGLKKRR